MSGGANRGKSTFFSAVTAAKVDIANYPFTTVAPNIAVGYATAKCPHVDFGKGCNPNNSDCRNGTRFIPAKMIDVAGLVPGAHEGKGLGNQFLDDLRQAEALIQVVDLSGGTDMEGQPCPVGSFEPWRDVDFLRDEIDQWMYGIVQKIWGEFARKIQLQRENFYQFMGEKLAGIGVKERHVRRAVQELGLDVSKPADWGDMLFDFTQKVSELSKPIIIAGNKCDIGPAKENLEEIKKRFPNLLIEPCSAESELALNRAAKAGLIKYEPGTGKFEIIGELDEKQTHGLELIREHVLAPWGSTGVQNILNRAIFKLLDLIVIYPVEDENKWCDKKGNILPDAFLVPRGATALDLAYKVHTSIGDNFVAAINAKTHMKLGKDHPLEDGDVIKIFAKS